MQEKGYPIVRPVMGPLSRDRMSRVVGGGNTALRMHFTLQIQQIKYIWHHRSRGVFIANRLTVEAVKARRNIEIIYDSTVEEITGRDFVEAVEIQNRSGLTDKNWPSAGFLLQSAGTKNQQFSSMLRLDGAGYIVAGEDCKTNISGVYVAGIPVKKVRQLVTAAADGCGCGYRGRTILCCDIKHPY